MKARDILLGEGLSDEDIRELKNQIEEVNYEYGDTSKATDADALKLYYNQKSSRLQRQRQELPRKIEQTKEYIERSAMGGEDVRSQKLQTVEEKRQEVMKRPTVIEKIDKSDIYFKGDLTTRQPELELMEVTGRGVHNRYGERHKKAKLTAAQATEIRRRWWVNKEPQITLSKEYGVADPTINNIIKRDTWSHLPQVEGEPDEVMNAPNRNDKKVLATAKKLGIEPVRNKIGHLALPTDAVLKLKAEKKIKAKE